MRWEETIVKMILCVLTLLLCLSFTACGRKGEVYTPSTDGPVLPVDLPQADTPGSSASDGLNGSVAPPGEAAPIASPEPPAAITNTPQILTYVWAVPPVYDDVSPFSGGLARVASGNWARGHLFNIDDRMHNRAGFINVAGETTIPLIYQNVGNFDGGVTWGVLPGGGSVIFNTNGHVTYELPTGVNIAWVDFSEGLFITAMSNDDPEQGLLGSRYGVTDMFGREVVTPMYDVVWPFVNGYARVGGPGAAGMGGGGFWGLIDTEGSEVIPPDRFNDIGNVSEGFFTAGIAANNRGYNRALFDLDGNEIIPFETYLEIGLFSGGLALVRGAERDGYRFGFVNTLGEAVIPLLYSHAFPFNEGLAAVSTGGESFPASRALDDAGMLYIHADAEIGSEWGFIDGTGKVVVPLQYNEVRSFSGGLAAVAVEASLHDGVGTQMVWGFVNTAGEEVVSPRYNWVSDFVDGFAIVNTGGILLPYFDRYPEFPVVGGTYMIIDRWGRELLVLYYDAVGVLSEGMLAVNQGRQFQWLNDHWQISEDGLWGFIRLNTTNNN
jgi:predicted small lipoprotein YifL